MLNHPETRGNEAGACVHRPEDTALLFSTTKTLQSQEVSDWEEGDDTAEKGITYHHFPALASHSSVELSLAGLEPALQARYQAFEEIAADDGPPSDSAVGADPFRSRKRRKGHPVASGDSESAPPASAVSSAAGVP